MARASRFVLIGAIGASTMVAAFARPDPEPRRMGPFGGECRVAFAPDGASLVATLRSGAAARVDLASGKRRVRYEGEREETGSAVAVSPDGKQVAFATLEGRVRVFDAERGELLAAVSHGGPVRSLAFCWGGAALVTGGGPAALADDPDAVDPEGPTARVWDAGTGAILHDLDAHTRNPASAVAASPSAPLVAVARQDGKLDLFDLEKKKHKSLELHAPSLAAAFSPDGALLAAQGGADGALLTVVRVDTGEVVRAIGQADGDTSPLGGALAFSPDGKLLAWVGPRDEGIRLFAVETGALQGTRAQPRASSLAFSPDGKTLASGLRTGEVLLHDLAPR